MPARWRAPRVLVVAALAAAIAGTALAARAVSAVDDAGEAVVLARPAQRIISLSPGITEMLFALGAGDRVVGVSDHSDTPPAARQLPRVARAQGIDLERIAALAPDLIVAWGSGYSPALLGALRRLAVPVYIHEPRTLESIATSMERLGALTGSNAAPQLAADFRARLASLREHYGRRAPVRVFYQVWSNPIMTLSGKHVVSEVMRVCGGRNVFEDLAPLVASVDVESVLAARPEVIVSAEPGAVDAGALAGWRRYPQLPAVAAGELVTLDADQIDRSTARILDAAQALCERLERARAAPAAPAAARAGR
jgi:iron complex transport system substrate-binding protein